MWPSNGAKRCQAGLSAGQGQTGLGTARDTTGQGTSRTIRSHKRVRGFGIDVILSPPPSRTCALLSSCLRPETRLQTEGWGLPAREAAGRRGCLLLKAFGAFHQGLEKQPPTIRLEANSQALASRTAAQQPCAPNMGQPQRFNPLSQTERG